MEEIKQIQKKYCSQAMFFAIAMFIVFLLLGEKAIGKGFLLGTLFSVINFVIMGQLMPLYLGKDTRPKASAFALISILLRFSILAVPMIISLKVTSIHFIGVVVGLFTVQLAILFDQIIINRLQIMKKAKNRV
jgi:hypothetical protein